MTAPLEDDELLSAAMRVALEAAEKGRFRVEPNPCVGAVVVSTEGEIVGRGFHGEYGEAHAEEAALIDAGEAALGATLVVTLEPCAHVRAGKKRPRCVDLILASGIRRVVIGAPDPDPDTTGRAATELRTAGIEVVEAVEPDACAAVLERFTRHLGSARPWVVAKWAMTLDGRIADATGSSRWVSGPEARAWTHRLRGHIEAIVVGAATARRDDPQLTCRADGLRSPTRVVVTSQHRLPVELRVLQHDPHVPTWVVGAEEPPAELATAVGEHVRFLRVAADESGSPAPAAVLARLRELGIRRLLVEGGGGLLGAWWRAGVIDQVACFVAPAIVGGDGAPGPYRGVGWEMQDALRLDDVRVTQLGADAMIQGFVPRP